MQDVIAIRSAHPDESDAIRRLALLDDAPLLRGPVLLGLIDGEPHVALDLRNGRVVADPFVRTAELIEMVRLGARTMTRDQVDASRVAPTSSRSVAPGRLELAA